MPNASLLAYAVPLGCAVLFGCGCPPGSGGPAPEALLSSDLPVTLLQTTDIHHHAGGAGQVSGAAAALGSYPRIAAYVESVRASAGHPVVLVDSGDWSMGTIYDLTLGRRPMALWFADALRYDCITLGNHEFDYGPAGLAGILGAARRAFLFRTPIVATNLELGGNADLAPYVGAGKAIRDAWVETLANGLRVGFLGLMGRDAAISAPAAAPVRFTDYSRNYALVQDRVDDLRRRQRCHLVIALDHAGTDAAGAGGEDVELARQVTGIDVIASGHMHNPLATARTVANGAWNTRICCAGAYGANVSRLDLVYHPGTASTTLEASENRAMGDGAAGPGSQVPADPAFALILGATDLELNRALAPVLTRVAQFSDYQPDQPAHGIFHTVGGSAQALQSNDRDAVPGPNGLGNLCADALRAVANGLLARKPAPDPTPFTAAAAATGVLRGRLDPGAPITFADVYGIMPLGLSPDPTQGGATGEPLISLYLDDTGLRELCALQLLGQAGLAGSSFYLHLSGLAYGLRQQEARAFFACAGAATAVALTRQRGAAGSAMAGRALEALAALPADQGAALRSAMAAGNPYAGAMVRLAGGDAGAASDSDAEANAGPDPNPDSDPNADADASGPARIGANLALLSQVAAAADHDAASGSTGLDTLLMARARAAIGTVSAFAPTDPACTGPTAPLAPGRRRMVLDRYALLMMDGAQARFGTRAPIYQAAQGDARLSGSTPEGRAAILANRISLDPGGAFQEVKAWMALLLYLTTPPAQGGHFAGGWITPEYGSTGGISQFPSFGAAVRVRNADYPLDRIRALMASAAALAEAP